MCYQQAHRIERRIYSTWGWILSLGIEPDPSNRSQTIAPTERSSRSGRLSIAIVTDCWSPIGPPDSNIEYTSQCTRVIFGTPLILLQWLYCRMLILWFFWILFYYYLFFSNRSSIFFNRLSRVWGNRQSTRLPDWIDWPIDCPRQSIGSSRLPIDPHAVFTR